MSVQKLDQYLEINNFNFFHRKRQQQSNSTGTQELFKSIYTIYILHYIAISIQVHFYRESAQHCCFKRRLQILAVKLPEIFCSLLF